MSNSEPFTVAVIGGGIAGLTLAIALHKRHIPVTIYEQAPQFGEIGAGVSLGPNAEQAMQVCDEGIYEAFKLVSTHNEWSSKDKTWFDYLDGTDDRSSRGEKGKTGYQDAAFTIYCSRGQTGAHRAHLLDEMVKVIPSSIAKFGKRLDTINEDQSGSGKMVMKFHDGSTAEADVVIGCDGIKSRVRQLLVGEDHPSAHPVYSHKYAYRGLIPMEQAVEVLGEERARNSCMHMGQGRHVLTFSVNHGKILNLVAFVTDTEEDWADSRKLTRPAKREEAMRDFAEFGPNVQALLKLTKPDLDVWAIFDTFSHPLSSYTKAGTRVCVTGDAAHATSPHHGAGAGYAIEDSAVLVSLLALCRDHLNVSTSRNNTSTSQILETALSTFDTQRRPRTQSLVRSSRRAGDLYEWRAEGIPRVKDANTGKQKADLQATGREIQERCDKIWKVDVAEMCKDAVEELKSRIEEMERGKVISS